MLTEILVNEMLIGILRISFIMDMSLRQMILHENLITFLNRIMRIIGFLSLMSRLVNCLLRLILHFIVVSCYFHLFVICITPICQQL